MPFGFGIGRGRGGRGFRGGIGGGGLRQGGFPTNCVCPNCGMIATHQRRVPCFQTKCPRCGSPMTRQFFYEE